ncbi:MAG: hypothetical protein WCV81_04455 [Microgenomates group bacterium]|jgi:hypothetical protein
MPKSFEKGFVPPVVILLLTIIGISAVLIIKNLPPNEPQPTNTELNISNSSQTKATPSSTVTPTKSNSQTPTPTQKTSPTPTSKTTTPTPTPNSYITLDSPNGGETFTLGEITRISWRSGNIGYVRIYVENPSVSGSGSTNYVYSDAIPASQGYYDWSILPNQLPGSSWPRNFKIRIDGVNETGVGANVITRDSSDNTFKVQSAPYNPYVRVTYPYNGLTFQVGSNVVITWETNMPLGSCQIQNIDSNNSGPVVASNVDVTRKSINWTATIGNTPLTEWKYRVYMICYDLNGGVQFTTGNGYFTVKK